MTIKKTVTGSLTEAELIEMIEEKCGFRIFNLQCNGKPCSYDSQFVIKSLHFEVDESQSARPMQIKTDKLAHTKYPHFE
jgi:hypothetical protein